MAGSLGSATAINRDNIARVSVNMTTELGNDDDDDAAPLPVLLVDTVGALDDAAIV
jgi:hypothetical protein